MNKNAGGDNSKMNLNWILNDQHLLELCLSYICEDISRFNGFAGEYLTAYAIKYYTGSNGELTEEELNGKVNLLLAEYTLHSLVEMGLADPTIEENGEISYLSTQKEYRNEEL